MKLTYDLDLTSKQKAFLPTHQEERFFDIRQLKVGSTGAANFRLASAN